LVRVADVEEGRDDLFLQLVMNEVARRELFLRIAGPSDDDPLDFGPVEERFRAQLADLLVPLVDGDVVPSLEPPGALSAHPVLGGNDIADHEWYKKIGELSTEAF